MMDSNVGRLLEVGVAVSDLEAARAQLGRVFSAPTSDVIVDKTFSMRFRMCRVGHADFELMQPDGSDSLIARFIARRGEGLHHIAFQVSDVVGAMAHYRELGIPPLSAEPVLLDNLKACFLPPRCLGGVLVEFIENLHTWVDGVPLPAPELNLATDPGTLAGAEVVGFGVLVQDLGAAAASFAAVLGAVNSDTFRDPELGVNACYSRVANVEFRLMAEIDNHMRSPIIAARGDGLHHVRLRVNDLERFVSELSSDGIGFVQPYIKRRGERQSVFTSPDSFNGVMYEIFQSSN